MARGGLFWAARLGMCCVNRARRFWGLFAIGAWGIICIAGTAPFWGLFCARMRLGMWLYIVPGGFWSCFGHAASGALAGPAPRRLGNWNRHLSNWPSGRRMSFTSKGEMYRFREGDVTVNITQGRFPERQFIRRADLVKNIGDRAWEMNEDPPGQHGALNLSAKVRIAVALSPDKRVN